MKKLLGKVFLSVAVASLITIGASSYASASSPTVHTVRSGDTMWRIALRYEVGVSELINANKQISNPNLIYPGQQLTIPTIDNVKAIEMEVVRLVNVERAKHGLSPLAHNWELSRVARHKSQDMINNNYFSHNSPVYGSPFDMMRSFGIRFSTAGENIAMGQRTAEAVMQGWMNSTGHRNNILSPNFTQIGVGYAVDRNGRPYWTQMFMRP